MRSNVWCVWVVTPSHGAHGAVWHCAVEAHPIVVQLFARNPGSCRRGALVVKLRSGDRIDDIQREKIEVVPNLKQKRLVVSVQSRCAHVKHSLDPVARRLYQQEHIPP